MIKITGLSKQYTDQTVLHNIDLNISKGEIHGLLGGSGAGKSTLLRCMNGLEPYDSGSLMVNGVEVKQLQGQVLRAFRKKIGMIFQDFALLERKTVIENVMLPMQCWHYAPAQISKKAHELLGLVGIADKSHSLPRELSGGQKQRVAIARTLALDPHILLCDEATSALDPVTTKSVLGLLKSINEQLGITMVVVTHQMDVAKSICERLSVLEHGEVVVSDTVQSIFIQNPPALQRLTGVPDIAVPLGYVGWKISLDQRQMQSNFFSELAIGMNVRYIMLYAQTDNCVGGQIGHFYIAVDAPQHEKVEIYLRKRKVPFVAITPDRGGSALLPGVIQSKGVNGVF